MVKPTSWRLESVALKPPCAERLPVRPACEAEPALTVLSRTRSIVTSPASVTGRGRYSSTVSRGRVPGAPWSG